MGRLHQNLLSYTFVLIFVFILTLLQPSFSHAAATEELLLDANTLAQMEERALHANPREQCFLYTELVHAMTEIAGHQMLAGETENAAATLKHVEQYAQLIHLSLADDTKRLMNAQKLMHHTTRRLDEYVHKASSEDRATMQATLNHLTQVEDELLNQVFAH